VTSAVLKAATRLRIVGRAGVGVDNIDVAEATKEGVMVMNTPNGNTVGTAQLAMSLLCSMARKVPAANMSVKEGKWDRKSYSGVEINAKTIGIVGCGRIGQVVAGCATALGMRVLGFDPIASTEALAESGVTKVDMDEIFKAFS
jgi:D-3-phosphoglycerate dehydrogenase / 2-oxoglutarate reductase